MLFDTISCIQMPKFIGLFVFPKYLQKKKEEKHKQKRVPLYQFIFDSLIEGVSFRVVH